MIFRQISPGFGMDGLWSSFTRIRVGFDRVRAGDVTIPRTQLLYTVQFSPSRAISQISLDGFLGEEVDFVGARPGHGGRVTASANIRPTNHLELQFDSDVRWLNVKPFEGGSEQRLFTAQVERLKATYTFTARSYLRAHRPVRPDGTEPVAVSEPGERAGRLVQRVAPFRLQAELADRALRGLWGQPDRHGGEPAREDRPAVLPEGLLRLSALTALSDSRPWPMPRRFVPPAYHPRLPRPSGSRLGPFEILAPIGAGGMGEVYRARDPQLGREVAIKVLPESLAKDPEALARFQVEARALAALSHPNILGIHDLDTDGDVSFAVMELLEGETLRDKLKDGAPLPQRKAVEYSREIARGLSAAHEKGIVHRDLKPENVFITKDERVKILDFGLAKRTEKSASEDETSSPTASKGTEPGTVMGTMGYMAPEQVRGLAVDHRADIFAFGAILYELLTGQRAFKGPTASDTLAAILRDEPPELTRTNLNIPAGLERIVRHCLEKSPEARAQSAHDLAFDLETLASMSGATGERSSLAVPSSVPFRRRGLVAVLGTAAVVVVAVVAVIVMSRRPAGRAGPRRCQAPGRPSLREPRLERGRLLRRRHHGRGAREADEPAGPAGHRAHQLERVQEDAEEAARNRKGAGCRVPAHGHRPLREGKRRYEARPGEPGAEPGLERGVAVGAAFRRDADGRLPGAGGDRHAGGSGARHRARGRRETHAGGEADSKPSRLRGLSAR